jgi:hypothetical protein
MTDYETVREKLLSQYRASKVPPHDGLGIYALFLTDRPRFLASLSSQTCSMLA